MSRIKIRNFGPIRGGFIENDGWIDVKKVSVFIGDQGSGKSTLAKLISVFSWLEKTIVRNKITAGQLTTGIFKNICTLQEILEYFTDDTHIEYDGDAFGFEYDGRTNSFLMFNNAEKLDRYVLPKVQYFSAARNLLSILYKINEQNFVDKDGNIIDMSSNIPYMVKDLSKEYTKALAVLAKDGFKLPVSETSVYFQNYNTFIKTRGNKVSMSSASSGIQSVTPLTIVSNYLANEVQKSLFEKVQHIDNNLRDRISEELSKIDVNLVDKFKLYYSLGKTVISQDEVSEIERVMKKFIPSLLINIVEEPEQNLFPTSQRNVLNSLLEINNTNVGNKLIITTHSPYLINYLTLAVKAFEMYADVKDNPEAVNRLFEVVPENSMVALDDVAIYELNEKDGIISSLGQSYGIPSNENYLNDELGETNNLFSKLMEIDDLCME